MTTPTSLAPRLHSRRVRPLLRWAGSKREALNNLAPYWHPGFGRYIEPFAGSASLFFHLGPPFAILGDLNKHVIELYATVRCRPKEVWNIWSRMPIDKSFYLELRSNAFFEDDPIQRAANFLYLNRNCFNGIFRMNKSGRFNVPFSGDRTGRPPSLEEFLRSAMALRKAKLVHADFESLIELESRSGDFIYFDPPYTVRNSRLFRQYGNDVFGLKDLLRLKGLLRWIDERGAFFLLSYADVEEIQPIASEWDSVLYRVRRNIAGFSASRKCAGEIAISNIKLEVS